MQVKLKHGKRRVWIAKYALSKGIYEDEIVYNGTEFVQSTEGFTYQSFKLNRDAFWSKGDAVDRARDHL